MPGKFATKTIGRYVTRIAAALFIGGFVYLGHITAGFVSAPRTPSPASGQIVPYSVHGTIVYITAEDEALLSHVYWFCGGTFLCIAFGIYLDRIRRIGESENRHENRGQTPILATNRTALRAQSNPMGQGSAVGPRLR